MGAKKQSDKGSMLIVLFPLVVMIILSIVGFFTKIWLFASFNAICIFFYWIFASVSEKPSKFINPFCLALIFVSGMLILHIAPNISDTIKVKAEVVSCKYDGKETDADGFLRDSYEMVIVYEVDEKNYSNYIYGSPKDVGDIVKLRVNKAEPNKIIDFSPIAGMLVGWGYIVLFFIICIFSIVNRKRVSAC